MNNTWLIKLLGKTEIYCLSECYQVNISTALNYSRTKNST